MGAGLLASFNNHYGCSGGSISIPMARTVGGIITAVFSLVNPEYV